MKTCKELAKEKCALGEGLTVQGSLPEPYDCSQHSGWTSRHEDECTAHDECAYGLGKCYPKTMFETVDCSQHDGKMFDCVGAGAGGVCQYSQKCQTCNPQTE